MVSCLLTSQKGLAHCQICLDFTTVGAVLGKRVLDEVAEVQITV